MATPKNTKKKAAKRAKKAPRAKRVVKKEAPVPEAEQVPKNGAGIPEEMDFFDDGGTIYG